MAQSNLIKDLLKRLEEGSQAIRSRYESLAKASDGEYRRKQAEATRRYTAAANAASASAKIDLKNNLERMADAGFLRSGETVQAGIAANADRAKALSALAVQHAQDVKGYESEMAAARAKLSLEGEKEAMDYETKLTDQIRDQANADREYEAQKQQQAFENSIKTQKLAVEREKANQKGEEQTQTETGLVPEKNPYDYVDDIVKQNSTYYRKGRYTAVDYKGIRLAISAVVKDTRLSYRYRYEMYLYGKSLGYL